MIDTIITGGFERIPNPNTLLDKTIQNSVKSSKQKDMKPISYLSKKDKTKMLSVMAFISHMKETGKINEMQANTWMEELPLYETQKVQTEFFSKEVFDLEKIESEILKPMVEEQKEKEEPTKKQISNEKRKQSCKKVGGDKKRGGHRIEKEFEKQFNSEKKDTKTEFGPTSDTEIVKDSEIHNIVNKKLGVNGTNVSNKSGNNIQINLGKEIPELACENNLENINNKEISKPIFLRHLKKTESTKPADMLVYKHEKEKKWIFFNMDHIIEYIVDNCKWRKLESGRLKGDFKCNDTEVKQYLTYEYRTNKGYFLGFNGNRGIEFIKLLMDPKIGIPYHSVDVTP